MIRILFEYSNTCVAEYSNTIFPTNGSVTVSDVCTVCRDITDSSQALLAVLVARQRLLVDRSVSAHIIINTHNDLVCRDITDSSQALLAVLVARQRLLVDRSVSAHIIINTHNDLF